MKEIWKDVVGFEGLYEVSNFGRIRGRNRYIAHPKGGQRLWRGRILKQTPHGSLKTYLSVSLCIDGVRYARTAHSIVCEAFHGPRPNDMQVAHKDGNGRNNKANNLSWKTISDNHADKHFHDTAHCGEKHYGAKLTVANVKYARQVYEMGLSQQEIADELGVSRRTIGRAIVGDSWSHVE